MHYVIIIILDRMSVCRINRPVLLKTYYYKVYKRLYCNISRNHTCAVFVCLVENYISHTDNVLIQRWDNKCHWCIDCDVYSIFTIVPLWHSFTVEVAKWTLAMTCYYCKIMLIMQCYFNDELLLVCRNMWDIK